MRALLLVLTRMVTGCSDSSEQKKDEATKGKSKKETKKRERATESGRLLILIAPFCVPGPGLFRSSFRPSFNTDLRRRLHR